MVDSIHTSQPPVDSPDDGGGDRRQGDLQHQRPGQGLLTVAGDFKTYYSLGYSPVHSGDGRYHKIDVRTKRKDLVVRHREGYRDKTTEAKMSDGVISALFYDAESNSSGHRGGAQARGPA